MDAFSEIQISELILKSRSKKEVYDLLCNEGSIYLPPIEDAHHKFISQILVGNKRCLKCSQVKVCRIPHLKGLTIEDLLAFGQQRAALNDYLSDYEYHKLLNRQWLCNVFNTLLGNTFTKFVQERVQERVKHVVRKKDLSVMVLQNLLKYLKTRRMFRCRKGDPTS